MKYWDPMGSALRCYLNISKTLYVQDGKEAEKREMEEKINESMDIYVDLMQGKNRVDNWLSQQTGQCLERETGRWHSGIFKACLNPLIERNYMVRECVVLCVPLGRVASRWHYMMMLRLGGNSNVQSFLY